MKTMKKLLAFLLVLCLFGCMAVPASAVNTQYGTTREFLKVMDREGHNYSYMGIDKNDDEEVDVSFTGDNKEDIDVEIYFDEDLDSVSLRSWYVISFDEVDLGNVLMLVNQMNSDYKYITFVVDMNDYSVDAKLDCPLRDDACAGEIAFDALYYIVQIVDDAYPEFAQYEK